MRINSNKVTIQGIEEIIKNEENISWKEEDDMIFILEEEAEIYSFQVSNFISKGELAKLKRKYREYQEDEPSHKRYKIFKSEHTLRVSSLYEDYKEGDLILNPKFQREFVWTKKTQSFFIESILLEVPIPPIFLSEENGKVVVVDGKQRLSTIFAFLNNDFKLSGLTQFSSVNGYKFNDIEEGLQKRIKRYIFRVVVIKEESDNEAKLDLFYRINVGSSKLTKQEVRNALYSNTEIYDEIMKMSESKLIPNYLRGRKEEYLVRFLNIIHKFLKEEETNWKRSEAIDNFYMDNMEGISKDVTKKWEQFEEIFSNEVFSNSEFKVAFFEALVSIFLVDKEYISTNYQKIIHLIKQRKYSDELDENVVAYISQAFQTKSAMESIIDGIKKYVKR